MSFQKNVQAQVEARKAAMIAAARSFPTLPQGVRALLADRGFDVETHALINFSPMPECCAHSYSGTFVTPDHRFIQFELTTTEDGKQCETVDEWADITEQTEINFRKPGIGKTDGALGLEVLGEIRASQVVQRGPSPRYH